MIGKKINQLATELAPVSTDLTIIGDPISGVSKKITLAQLGAIFSGAVSFYNDFASFPATGDINVIYCAKDTKKLYLWSGSAYVEVFPSQALLNTYQLRSEKGVSNGYASLDAAGKVPISQLPSSIMEYKGTWNAATNTPTLTNGTGDTGDVYICNVAGTVNFGAGPLTFAVGDYVIYSGTIWQRSSGAVGTVTSVAASITGNSIGITGSPVTTSGTLALAFSGTSAQYINGAGNLITFPSIISQAQNLITEVYNKSGATITKGTVVYINGGQGNLPSIAKALATGDATSAQTYGIVQADITNMNNGYVVAAGRLGDLDTSAFTEGTQLYLSATTAGTYTSTKQYAPNHLVYVAIVVRAHPTQGVIEVKIQNGYEMDELHNVAAQSPSNGDILQYVTSTSLWTKTAGTTTNIAEGTNLYYTEARVNANTNVAANTAARHNAVTIGTANGLSLSTQVLSLALASGSTTGALSSTDWTTFNSKQNALTNPVTGTGVSGQVTFFNGTSTVTGTNNHFWDATNNRLGIGTTTPQRSIEIFNATADNHLRLSGNAPSVSMGEAVTGSIYQAKFGLVTVNGQFVTAGVAGDFVIISQTGATIIGTSSTEKMRVQSSGNVSINNTNNTYKLDVTGTARLTGQLRLESTITDGTYTYTLPSATGTLALTSALSGMITGTGTTNYLPKFTGTSTIGNSIIFDNGTNVGIGTATPNDKFSVVGNVNLGNNYTASYILDINKTTDFDIRIRKQALGGTVGILFETANDFSGTSQAYIKAIGTGSNGRSQLIFGTASNVGDTTASTKMTLDASGNLGLGVTPSAWGSNRTALQFGALGCVFSDNNVTSEIGANVYISTAPAYTYITSNFATRYTQINGQFQWHQAPSGAAGNAISFTQAMTLNASGNLSVGNTNDTYKLDVSGSARFNGSGSNGYLYVSGNAGAGGSTNPAYLQGMNFSWNKSNGGGESLITYTGAGGGSNVRFGIGYWNNSTYAEQFSIASTGAATFSSNMVSINGNGLTEFKINNNTSEWELYMPSGGTDLRLYRGSDKVTFLANGSVGIGTTSPAYTLDVVGEIRALQTSNSGISQLIADASNTTGYRAALATFGNTAVGNLLGIGRAANSFLYKMGGTLVLGTENAFPLIFSTSDTERMRISSGGLIYMNNLGGYSGSFSDVRYDTSSKELFYQTSSRRYKDNIVNLENTLSKVNQLRAVRFIDKHTQRENCGFIAEEVIEIIPDVVFKKEIDGKLEVEGINYSDFAPFIIKALQEQQAEIEALKLELKNK